MLFPHNGHLSQSYAPPAMVMADLLHTNHLPIIKPPLLLLQLDSLEVLGANLEIFANIPSIKILMKTSERVYNCSNKYCMLQVNLLSVVLNDAPILPEADEDVTSLLKDSPQCMAFGLFMIWFASVTVNLGPTFLSGALAANAGAVMDEPSCPLVQVGT